MLTDAVEIQWVTSNSRFLMGSRHTMTPLIGWFRVRSWRPESSDAFLQTSAVFAAPFIFIGAWNSNYWLIFTLSKCWFFFFLNLDRGIDERRECDGGVVKWVLSHHPGRQSPAWPGLNALLKVTVKLQFDSPFLSKRTTAAALGIIIPIIQAHKRCLCTKVFFTILKYVCAFAGLILYTVKQHYSWPSW